MSPDAYVMKQDVPSLRHAIFMSHVCRNSKGREFLPNTAFISLVPITPVIKDLYV